MTNFDLTPFCSIDPTRPHLHRPFSRGDFTYATNGHVMIRVRRRADVPEVEDSPDCEGRIISKLDLKQPFAPIPAVDLSESSAIECPDCEGRGTQHECPGCSCLCSNCKGRGNVTDDQNHSIQIGNTFFAAKYARIVFPLVGIEMPSAPSEREAVPFRFDGGIGAWMPILGERLTNTVVLPSAPSLPTTPE